ncbi:MAG: hypothetical protein OJF47_003876 [Nitrospira sp.]|nr:MAG: hypothetical protein OJF47_003876 [Nitrospira sp.]
MDRATVLVELSLAQHGGHGHGHGQGHPAAGDRVSAESIDEVDVGEFAGAVRIIK